MKKILVIGAGFLQSFIIKRAKEMGFHTITIDKNPDSVGFKYADEYEVIDIVNEKECLVYAQKNNIDGVLTAATDYGVLSASFIAKKMKLPGLNYEVAQTIKNKYLVRKVLFENNIDEMQQFYEVESLYDLNRIVSSIKFPVIVKPADGSGSKATRKVNSAKELKVACKEAIQSSIIKKALIEDFIEGVEYGIESFVYNNKTHILGIMGKYMSTPPTFAELGHHFPINLDVYEEVENVVKRAIRALGINFGAVNMDVLISKDNRIYVIDIGARMGGNLIGSHIIPIGTGFDYMGNLIKASVGESIEVKLGTKKNYVVTRILALTPGIVKEIPDIETISKRNNVDIYHQLKIKMRINKYTNNLDGCGYIVSSGKSFDHVRKMANRAKQQLNKGIIRE